MESQSKEMYQFEAYQPIQDQSTMRQATDLESVASRVISDRAYQNGVSVVNKSYFFDASCDMSQLQNADLSSSTIHFKGPVYIDTLQHLNLSNVTLIFNDGIQSRPQKPSKSTASTEKQLTKLTKGQKRAMKKLQEATTAPPPKVYKSDSELQAAMSTSIENIEQAVHPERLALLSSDSIVKAEVPVPIVMSVSSSNSIPVNSLPRRPPTPDNLGIEDGEVVDDIRIFVDHSPPPHIAAERPRRASAMTAFVRADLKRQGIFPSPDTSEEPEPKRIKLETTDAQSKCPFIKCEGD